MCITCVRSRERTEQSASHRVSCTPSLAEIVSECSRQVQYGGSFTVPFEWLIVDDDLQSVNMSMLQFSNDTLTDLAKNKTTQTRKEKKERKKERKKKHSQNGTDAPSEKHSENRWVVRLLILISFR